MVTQMLPLGNRRPSNLRLSNRRSGCSWSTIGLAIAQGFRELRERAREEPVMPDSALITEVAGQYPRWA
jgi:hypothetical protein